MSSNATAEGETTPLRLPLFGNPLGTIRASLHSHHLPKWGLLIYRCDYRSDATWDSFMATLHWNMAHAFSILNAPDLAASLDMPVQSDQSALDGASVDQVRDAFKAWVDSTEAKEERKDAPLDWGGADYPRYTYCVHVDADAVDSVVMRAPQPPMHDFREKVGYVNLVRLDNRRILGGIEYNIFNTTQYIQYVEEEEEEEEEEEDCGDENVARAPVCTLFGPEMYGDLHQEGTFDHLRKYAFMKFRSRIQK